LGTIGEHIQVFEDRILPAPTKEFQANKELTSKVLDIALFPGFRPSVLRTLLFGPEGVQREQEDEVHAIVLRTFGAGNAPDHPALLKVFEDAAASKKTIVNTTQCNEGIVEMGLYESSTHLLERGVISALDMTPEAALTKLMWTLGTKLGEQVVPQMQVSQRGEQSQNLFDLSYGGCGNEREPRSSFAKFRTPDRRFDADRLERAVLRFSGLGVSGIDQNRESWLRVFINLPNASASTPATHLKCVAELSFIWDGVAMSRAHPIDTKRSRSAMGEGDITLSVVAPEGVKFWFQGLFLALFTSALPYLPRRSHDG
jgi:L-asparaginase